MIYFIGILIEFISELVIQLVFSLGFRRVNDIFRHYLVTSVLFGMISGFVSLIFFEEVLITETYLRVLNLLVTPVLLGGIMSLIGKIYDKYGLTHSTLDNFIAGFSFGMAMTLVRFAFG